jgi:hypothetical protein
VSRAFNEGDPVPVSHVERGVVTRRRRSHKTTTKAGRAAAGVPDDPKG